LKCQYCKLLKLFYFF